MRRAPESVSREKLAFSVRNLEFYLAKINIIVKIDDAQRRCCTASNV